MCTSATARRRRRQAAIGYRHLDRMRRPKHRRKSAEKAKRHLEALVARERAYNQRKGAKNK